MTSKPIAKNLNSSAVKLDSVMNTILYQGNLMDHQLTCHIFLSLVDLNNNGIK